MNRLNVHNNFIWLTISLIVLLMASAMVGILPPGFAHLFLQAVTTVTLIVSYLSLSFGSQWRRFVGSIVVLMLVSSTCRELLGWGAASIAELLLMLTFFTAAAYSASRQVLLSGKVEPNTVVGSIAIYLLLGLIWALLYLLVLEFSSGAFNGLPARDWVENFSQATYFSYVTLTTLGYGDISPAEPLSRVLVYLEAITGVFYMAIVVASLIGARATRLKD